MRLEAGIAAVLFVCALAAAPLAAQQEAQPAESYRLDYTLVRTGPEGATEREFSMLVTSGQGGNLQENSSVKMARPNEWQKASIGLRTTLSEVVDDSIVVKASFEITEVDPALEAHQQSVRIAASTNAKVALGETASLFSMQSQDGLRKYELRLTANRVEE